jgi:hypothetical protein
MEREKGQKGGMARRCAYQTELVSIILRERFQDHAYKIHV